MQVNLTADLQTFDGGGCAEMEGGSGEKECHKFNVHENCKSRMGLFCLGLAI